MMSGCLKHTQVVLSIFSKLEGRQASQQRIGWDDFRIDYTAFSDTLSDEHFPVITTDDGWTDGSSTLGGSLSNTWLMRGCSCYFVDLDPRWVKRLIVGNNLISPGYMDHVIDQALTIIKHRSVSACLPPSFGVWRKERLGKSRYQGCILWRNNHGYSMQGSCRRGLRGWSN